MSVKARFTLRIASFILLGFVVGNLLFLNYIVFTDTSRNSVQVTTVASVDENIKYCDNNECVTSIYKAISEATRSGTDTKPTDISNKGVGEFFISLGSGVSSSTDWTDVPGVKVTTDSRRYQSIERVVFEAVVFIPTGNQTVSVRLFNKTAKHPVWFSEVSHSGGEQVLLVSDALTLESGENEYQVQMKSTLGYDSHLVESRIRIQTK